MSRLRRVGGGLLAGLLSAGVLLVLLYHQQLLDQWRVWQYQPSSDIQALAQRAALSDSGRFYFYLAHPQLETAEQFNQDCRRVEQASPILGCYDGASERIHIYRVMHPELDGIKEVTAAHEMLHVAWSRFSQAQRQRLSDLLEAAYQRVKTDDLTERMAYYERAQPGSRANELHSILGTEAAELGEELEQHYRQFFTDRQAVVALHAGYTKRFTALAEEADRTASQLETRRRSIEQRMTEYRQAVAGFNREVAVFNQRAERGDFVSQEAFLAVRSQLAARSQALVQQRQEIEAAIAEYNRQVDTLTALGRRLQSLQQGLDSQQEVR